MSEEVVQVASEELPSETVVQSVGTKATYLAGLFLYFLPFINIQCVYQGETYTHTQSGLQMAFGGTSSNQNGVSHWDLSGDLPEPWMIVYGVCLALALVLSLLSHRAIHRGKEELVLSLACLTCLLIPFVVLDKYRSLIGRELREGSGRVEYTVFLYLSILAHIIGVCFAYSRLRREQSASSASPSGGHQNST